MALPAFFSPFDGGGEGDLGEIRNELGILSPDFKHFYPKPLVDLVANGSDLAAMLGVQRTQLYSEKIPLKKGTKLRRRLIQLVMATDLVYALNAKNREKSLHWLITPNLMLFGDTPLEVIVRDEGDALIAWLMQRSGLQAGPAF